MCLVLLPNLADAKTKSQLGVSTVYADKGTVDVGIFLSSDVKLAGGSFDLVYDPNLLRVRESDINVGSPLTPFLSSVNGAEAGRISLAFANGADATVDGTLLTFKATLLKTGETVDLKFTNVQLHQANGTVADVKLLNGQIKPFNGETKIHEQKVAGNKEWTVNLSTTFDPATLNEHTVSVKMSGRQVDVTLTPKDATSFIVKPKTNYARGTYTLEISEQLRSINGGKLKQPIRHQFTVQ